MEVLEAIVKDIGASSAAIMAPNIAQRHMYCYESFNMPPQWVTIKNSFDEKISGGNIEVYKSGKPAITNHLRKVLEGHYIESVMIVPIQSNGTVIATLELIHSQDNKTFSSEDLQKATNFANKLQVKLR